MVIDEQALSELDAEQLRQVSQRLLAELRHQRALNEKLAYECALLKRLKFAAKSERHSAEQRNLLEEELDSELAAVEHEIEQLRPTQPVTDKQQARLRRTSGGSNTAVSDSSPSARRCRPICHDTRSATNPRPRHASAVANSSALARM